MAKLFMLAAFLAVKKLKVGFNTCGTFGFGWFVGWALDWVVTVVVWLGFAGIYNLFHINYHYFNCS